MIWIQRKIKSMHDENNLFIITPSYNSSKFIEECINSVICQTYKEWEMIIVDDCSKDDTTQIITKYSKKDNRIKVINLEENIGACKAKYCDKRIKRKIHCVLDSDDLWNER